ncbi:MAG: hypothetical protein JO101_06655 [Candidatus Eremiobacteraeota bacterium]|nr:hypothetical protein [Candidatus Eremiobacteraeota bacterium]
MFLRVRGQGVTHLDSTVEIREILGAARGLPHGAMAQIARAIHAAYPDAALTERRDAYVRGLQVMLSGGVPAQDTLEGLVDAYRSIAGSRFIQGGAQGSTPVTVRV